MAELQIVLAHWPWLLLGIYLGFGLQFALREVLFCIRENRATGERAPLWPVWIVVTLAWPMLLAQRFVFWMIVLWDAASAIRAEKREAAVSRLLAADPGARAGAAAPSPRSGKRGHHG